MIGWHTRIDMNISHLPSMRMRLRIDRILPKVPYSYILNLSGSSRPPLSPVASRFWFTPSILNSQFNILNSTHPCRHVPSERLNIKPPIQTPCLSVSHCSRIAPWTFLIRFLSPFDSIKRFVNHITEGWLQRPLMPLSTQAKRHDPLISNETIIFDLKRSRLFHWLRRGFLRQTENRIGLSSWSCLSRVGWLKLN